MIFKRAAAEYKAGNPALIMFISSLITPMLVVFFIGTVIWSTRAVTVDPAFALNAYVHAGVTLILAYFRTRCDRILKRKPIRMMINKIVLLFTVLTHSKIVLTYINGDKITTRIHGNMSSENLEAMKDFIAKITEDAQAKMAVQALKETLF